MELRILRLNATAQLLLAAPECALHASLNRIREKNGRKLCLSLCGLH